MKIIVIGGAGYIGSHTVIALAENGFEPITYDNFSTGYANSVLYGSMIRGDISDARLLKEILTEHKPDAVIHFAGSIEAGESVESPLKYYRNNTMNMIPLLESMQECGINKLIYSSSAAVYGNCGRSLINEDAVLQPENPYGWSKVFSERIIQDHAKASDLRYVALRYFNAAGADRGNRIGEKHNPESHLIPIVLKACKSMQTIMINGDDYNTPDGTCIRDYVHVDDLANAHVLALKYLLDGGKNDVFNCGYGRGYSVKDVINSARRVTGLDISVDTRGRRSGDAPCLIADNRKSRQVLNWKPAYADLDYIVHTAWEWEQCQ